MIGSFNSLLEKQKKDVGECRVSTVLFDDRMEVLHRRTDIRDVAPISDREYSVRGMTALLDAFGHSVRWSAWKGCSDARWHGCVIRINEGVYRGLLAADKASPGADKNGW